jgi:formylglycine-generating enzyme required for sulfatase activity
VGSFRPNAFGLYDMHGNVWEWTRDCWHYSYEGAPGNGSAWESGTCERRVVRGGSWGNTPEDLRAVSRVGYGPDYRNERLGVRLARDL